MTFDIGPNLDAVLIALIAAIGSIISAYFARKASNAVGAVQTTASAIQTTTTQTHDLVNGQSQQLLANATAEGVRQGVAAERAVPTP